MLLATDLKICIIAKLVAIRPSVIISASYIFLVSSHTDKHLILRIAVPVTVSVM